MKRKILKIVFYFILLVFLQLTSVCWAKYNINSNLKLEVYIDKTAPIINIVGKDKNETYTTSNLTDIIKNSSEVTINTSDNIKVDKNEYYYNSTEKNFNDLPANSFDSGKEFTEDGYYKIVTTDTSRNKTEIIILIDKTVPDVRVNFYKKGEEQKKIANSKQVLVAGTTKHLLAENELSNTDDVVEEIIQENPMLRAARSTSYVTNETELRNALAYRTDIIYTRRKH